MSAFVKNLVAKASLKKPGGGFSDSLKADDVNLRLVFHYGIPSGSTLLAYDPVRQILAISTKDGQIKLFGRDGSQALLESSETVASKFLLFIGNHGILVHVNVKNHIEVWDMDKKRLSSVHYYEKEITAFAAMQFTPFLYAGDSDGAISVLRLDPRQCKIELMKYHIPLSPSHGMTNELGNDIAVKFILPQPTAETKRILIIYKDGVITLWGIQESKAIFTSNGSTAQSMLHETKSVTAACWACAYGSKVVVGYSNGDIAVLSVPCPSDSKTEQASQNESCPSLITLFYKLNLGFKADKVPIAKLKWSYGDGKSSRLYVFGASGNHTANLLQVVLLNEHTESRTIKLGLHPPEALVDLELATCSIEQNKNWQDTLLLLAKSNHLYTYDDSSIQRYLAQCQTKSSPSLPKEMMIKLPYGESSITTSQFITSIPCMPTSTDEDINMLAKNSLALFPFDKKLKDGNNSNAVPFSKARNLFITGHSDGALNFWDASYPLFLPVASITQQSENDFSVSGVPLTAFHFDYESQQIVSGDQSGTVRIYALKSEPFAPLSSFAAFQGSSKKGSNHIVRRIKLIKVNGAVLSIITTANLKQIVVGSEQGYVSLIDLEGPTVLYQRQITSEFSSGIVSMQFETCSFHGFEKDILLVATKDSSILTLESNTGNSLSSGIVRPKKPSKALFTKILDGRQTSRRGYNMADGVESSTINSENSIPKQSLLLLCSEKAAYLYSLLHLVQGIKKVLLKKKFHSSCFWASTFGSSDDGLILIFGSGKIEIRSLPELSLLKETTIRGFTFSVTIPPSPTDIVVSSSNDGELVIINSNQQLLFVSTLHTESYRLLESVSQVYDENLVTAQGPISSPTIKEKKKGLFGSIIKDNKSTKAKDGVEVEAEDSRQSIEEFSTIFSTLNFATGSGIETTTNVDEDADLDIDDIDIDDPKEKSRAYPVIAGLNRKNITNTFQAIKGKLKNSKAKNEKESVTDTLQDEKPGAIDQIKKKYGYASAGDTTSAANTSRTKLSENLKKLQGINLKTSEMQDTARSFSSMAKEVLRYAEK